MVDAARRPSIGCAASMAGEGFGTGQSFGECSIAAFAVDRVRRPLTGSYRVGGCEQSIRDGFNPDFAGVVWRDDDVWMAPERMRRCQRFRREHVECGACELTVFQRSRQIIFDQMFAATDLNEIAAASHLAEQFTVENT